MQQVTDSIKTFTLDEYILLDEKGPDKHEYYYGKLIAMPGESLLHNRIAFLLSMLLHNLLEKQGFNVYIESVKVNIEGEEIYVYPDVTVIENQPEADLPKKDYIIYQPLLIAEVLSDSTRKYDLTDKFIQYQKISSLQYYITVEPAKHLIHLFEKAADGDWTAKTFTELTETINLPQLNAAFTLADIYKK